MKATFIALLKHISPLLAPIIRLSLFCITLYISTAAYAANAYYENWDITGFGTLGYSETNKYSDLIPKRNNTQRSQTIEDQGWLVDSRLGLQLRKELGPNWNLLGQLVAKEKTRNTLANSVEMAFLRYQASDTGYVQVGRIAQDIFLLSDHRNVGYSYHWVRPPTEFYGWIPFSYYDGIKVGFEFMEIDSLLRLEFYAGNSEATINIGYGKGGSYYNTAKTEPIISAGVSWEKNNLTLRGNVTQFRISEDTEATAELKSFTSDPNIQSAWPEASQISQDYSVKGAEFAYISVGASWAAGPWVVQGEVSDIGSDSFGTYDGQRAYLLLGRRFSEFLPHITYSRSWDDRDYPYDPGPATLEALDSLFQDSLYSGIVNQYTVSVGLRWDFASQKALKLQCDRTTVYDGSLGIYPTPEPAPRNWQKDVRSWCSTTLDWIF